MARQFTTGFELQSATATMEVSDSTGATIDTSIKRSGAASAKVSGSIGAGTAVGIGHQMTMSNKVFARYAVYVDSIDNNDAVVYFQCLDAALSSFAIAVQITYNGSTWDGVAYLNDFNDSQVLDLTGMTFDAWHVVEFMYDKTGGAVEMRFDGVAQGSDPFTLATTPAYWEAGVYNAGAGSISGTTVYFDDVAINDTTGSQQNSWPGLGKVVHLYPNAQGDNNGWLKSGGGAGSSTNYQDVDETTPDDATTYVKRTSGTPIDDHNVASSGSAGIGSSDTIVLVAVGSRPGSTSATAGAGRQLTLRLKSASGGTTSTTTGIDISVNGWMTHKDGTNKVYQLTSYLDPTTGAAWTPTGTNSIDNMQIGYTPTSSSTNEIRMSTIWALVEYVPVGVTTQTKTVQAKARIFTPGVAKTVTAKARLKTAGNARTITAKARVKNTMVQTVQAKGRIFNTIVRTVTAKARVLNAGVAKTIQAKARLVFTRAATIQSKARVFNTMPQTVQSKARIFTPGVAKTVQAQARVKQPDNTRSIQAKSRILNAGVAKTITAKARMVSTQAKTVQAKARVFNTVVQTVTAKARMKTTGVAKTVQAQARMKVTGTAKTVTSKARVFTPGVAKTITAKASIVGPANIRTVQAKARIKKTGIAPTVTAQARIFKVNTRTIQAKARVFKTQAPTIQSKGRIKVLGTVASITARGRIKKGGIVKTITAKARIAAPLAGFHRLLSMDQIYQKSFSEDDSTKMRGVEYPLPMQDDRIRI